MGASVPRQDCARLGPWLAVGLLVWCVSNAQWTLDRLRPTPEPAILAGAGPRAAHLLAQIEPLAAELQRVLERVPPSGQGGEGAEAMARNAAQRFLADLEAAWASGVPGTAGPRPALSQASLGPDTAAPLRRFGPRSDKASAELGGIGDREFSTVTHTHTPELVAEQGASMPRPREQIRAPAVASPSPADMLPGLRVRTGPSGLGQESFSGSGLDGIDSKGSAAGRVRIEPSQAVIAPAPHGIELRVNEDFNLYDELRSRHFDVSAATRIKLQMSRLRALPIFGVIENKLLGHSLLHSLGMPTMPVAYGGLSRAQLGEWGIFQETLLRAALAKAHGWGSGAVLKPATDGGSVGTLLLSGFGTLPNGSLQFRVDRYDHGGWRRLRWSMEAMVAHARAHLGDGASAMRWGQKFMHIGIMLQEQYGCAKGECPPGAMMRAMGVPCGGRGLGCILELKAHIVFGRLSCILIEQVPIAFNVTLYVTVHDDGSTDCAPSPGAAPAAANSVGAGPVLTCGHFTRIVQPLLPTLAEQAAKLSSVILADWFRLDVFVGHPKLGMRVNEITYPSHVHDKCALRQWLHKYRTLRLIPTSGRVVFNTLARSLGIDNYTFFNV